MTSRYNIDALRNDNGTYGRAGVAFIRGALRCGHTAHIQTDLGTLAIRPYTIDEVRTYSGKRAGEVVFPGEAVGHNWLLEFYPPNHRHGDEIQWRGRSQRAALAFAFSHLNGQAHHFAHGESIKYWSNQADRDATVLAVIDDEVLIEYEMPGNQSVGLQPTHGRVPSPCHSDQRTRAVSRRGEQALTDPHVPALEAATQVGRSDDRSGH